MRLKLIALRIDPSTDAKDLDDLVQLTTLLALDTPEAALALVRQFFNGQSASSRVVTGINRLYELIHARSTDRHSAARLPWPRSLSRLKAATTGRSRCQSFSTRSISHCADIHIPHRSAVSIQNRAPVADPVRHAMLGAVAEHLAQRWHQRMPAWVHQPCRFLTAPCSRATRKTIAATTSSRPPSLSVAA